MTNRKTLQYSSWLQVFSLLGCFALLLSVLLVGMYWLTLASDALSVVLIQIAFLLSGTLGLIAVWKFLNIHVIVRYANFSVYLRRRLTGTYRALRNIGSAPEKVRKHFYDQFKQTT